MWLQHRHPNKYRAKLLSVEVWQEVPVEVPGTTWPCPACTFENPVAAAACDICASPKPPPGPVKVVKEGLKPKGPQPPATAPPAATPAGATRSVLVAAELGCVPRAPLGWAGLRSRPCSSTSSSSQRGVDERVHCA